MKLILLIYTTLCSALIYANEHQHISHENDTSSLLPEISVIIDMSYVHRNTSDAEAMHLELPGIAHGFLSSESHGTHEHTINNAKNGLNFNYAELLISKEILHDLNFEAIFHATETTLGIDELYLSSASFSDHLNIKAGKFRSNFGYLNQYHHHSYNFSDMPLVYEGFLGMHGLNEIGLQVQVHLPTPFEVMLGAEILEGVNEQMFANDAMHLPTSPNASSMHKINAKSAPSLYVLYLKTSFEIDKIDFLAGLSYANGTSKINHIDDEEPSAFSGSSSLSGADLLLKYHFKNHSILSWQSELISRKMTGENYVYNASNNLSTTHINQKQSGLYTQFVYEYNEHYSFGARYENIYENSAYSNLEKYSAMFTYSPIEAVKLRLQYNRNKALFDEEENRMKIDTVILQLNITIGHHKAHKLHDEH